MTHDQKEVVKSLASACTREEWLTLIAISLPTLLQDQLFLLDMILREAGELPDSEEKTHAECVKMIMDELGLKMMTA